MTDEAHQFQVDRLQEVLIRREGEFEALWLRIFKPVVRERDESVVMFHVENPGEELDYRTPMVIPVFEGAFTRQGEGLGLEAFAKGAASMSNLLGESQIPQVGEFLTLQVQAMGEAQVLPAVDETLITRYVDVAIAILMNEETTTWRDGLMYNAGAWWLLSFMDGLTDKVEPGLMQKVTHVDRVRSILLRRAEMGTFDGYLE